MVPGPGHSVYLPTETSGSSRALKIGTQVATELLLIRHAPSRPPGRLFGRTDVSADLSEPEKFTAMRAVTRDVERWLSSPATRCRETFAAIWGDTVAINLDARLWEQDFGDWEGLAHKDIPDIGALTGDALAGYRAPGGESFSDVCARVHPALRELAASDDVSRIAIVAHAGVIRAALALALGAQAPALSFEVQPMSITKLQVAAPNAISITCTNWCPQCP